MAGGVDANAGTGEVNQIAVGGTWATGDKITLEFIDSTGQVTQVGFGDVTGLVPTFVMTYQKKLNFLAGTNWYFSDIDRPTVFNDPNGIGNGFIALANNFAASENFLALLPFQGRIAVHGRTNWQLWSVGSLPDEYQLVQTLPNVPTIAGQTVIGIGQMDGLFLTDTGVRQLRVVSTTLNAETVDAGSPIDSLIQTLLLSCNATEKAAACAVREPSTGLYWVFLKNTIYVFAYYPTVKILAWSQWEPTYQTTNVFQVSNNSILQMSFKLGMTSDESLAETAFDLNVSTSQTLTKPYAYIFYKNTASQGPYTALAITGGLAFHGTINFTAGNVAFTSNQTAFTPQKFVVHQGMVFVRTSDKVYSYGGSANATYDNTIAVMQTSFLPFEEPGRHKTTTGVEADITGTWGMYGSSSYLSDFFMRIFDSTNATTYDKGNIAFRSTGTHVQLLLQTTGTAEKCIINGLVCYWRDNDSKGVNR